MEVKRIAVWYLKAPTWETSQADSQIKCPGIKVSTKISLSPLKAIHLGKATEVFQNLILYSVCIKISYRLLLMSSKSFYMNDQSQQKGNYDFENLKQYFSRR